MTTPKSGRGKIYDSKNATYSFADRSGFITEEMVIRRKLFDTKWRMKHAERNPNINEMSKEAHNLKFI